MQKYHLTKKGIIAISKPDIGKLYVLSLMSRRRLLLTKSV